MSTWRRPITAGSWKWIPALTLSAAITIACGRTTTPIEKASEEGDLEKVTQAIHEAGTSSESKAKALSLAAAHNHIEIVRALLGSGVDVNTMDRDGVAPLMAATMVGHYEIVVLLLKAGADPKVMDKTELPIIHAAVLGAPLKIKEEVKNSWSGRKTDSAIEEEVVQRHLKIVQALLAAGADVNARNMDGWTPLMTGMLTCDLRILKSLIDAGVDVNARAKDGMTALMIAAAAGKVPEVELLIGSGADINAKYRTGETALTVAASRNRSEVVRMLIAAGATG